MIQHILLSKPFRRPSLSRHARLSAPFRTLALPILTGALAQVAQAQASGTPAAQPSALYSLVSTLSVFAFFALLVGAVRPKTFAFLFHEKATRGRVCGAFGAAWFFLVVLAGPLRPKPVATAPTANAPQSAPAKDQSAVRLAENRARAAEARAEKAEKAAASANAKANAKGKERVNRERVNRDLGIPESLSQTAPESKSAPAKEPLADNVSVVNIEGMGKREMGVVDEVAYVIGQADTAPALGPQVYRREADGMFYVLQVVANNTAKSTHDVTTLLMKIVDDQGREFDPSTEGSAALAATGDQSAQPFSTQLQPGVAKRFTLVFDAPADASGLHLKIPAGSFSFGKDALIQVPTANE